MSYKVMAILFLTGFVLGCAHPIEHGSDEYWNRASQALKPLVNSNEN